MIVCFTVYELLYIDVDSCFIYIYIRNILCDAGKCAFLCSTELFEVLFRTHSESECFLHTFFAQNTVLSDRFYVTMSTLNRAFLQYLQLYQKLALTVVKLSTRC